MTMIEALPKQHLMKKKLSIALISLSFIILSSCNSSMQRDVKRLAHKTEQCFSMIDGASIDDTKKDEFESCYEGMEKLMDKYDKKYHDEKKSVEFSKLFLEEIRKSDVPDDVKNMIEEIYAINL